MRSRPQSVTRQLGWQKTRRHDGGHQGNEQKTCATKQINRSTSEPFIRVSPRIFLLSLDGTESNRASYSKIIPIIPIIVIIVIIVYP